MRAARFLVVASLLFTLQVASAQDTHDGKLVYVHVVVTNSTDQMITGLGRESFKIWEDNQQQNITYYANGNTPISVGVVLDGSAGWRDLIKAVALPAMTKDRMQADEIFLADYRDLTPNEAVYQAANRVLKVAGNSMRAVVLFTDRYDPSSYSYSKLKEVLRDHEMEFYVFAAPSPASTNPRPADITVLRQLADATGGAVIAPSSLSEVTLEQLSHKLVVGLRSQYRIGYRPTNAVDDGKWRKIKVTVEDIVDSRTNKVKKLKARAKTGYYAPTAASAVPAKK
jgi:hypothetical protein